MQREALFTSVVALVSDNAYPDLDKAVFQAFVLLLYEMCSNETDSQVRDDGYITLHCYLYNRARQRYPDVCEDAVQNALEAIYISLWRCRQPQAFLMFAFQHLRDEAKKLWKQTHHDNGGEESLSAAQGQTGDLQLGDLLRSDDPNAEELLLQRERVLQVRWLISEFMHKHRRATQQFAALWLKHIGLSDIEIGQRLGKPVKRVHELRALAVRKLREDEAWRSLASDYGLLNE